LDRIIEKSVDWDPLMWTSFEEPEETILDPGGFMNDIGAMDATHRLVAAFHSLRENDLLDTSFALSLAGNFSSMSTKESLYRARRRAEG